jgi:hypothetical protein
MNLYSDNAQIGFLIGIYFLASAIAALTLVYFSRPKPKKGELKDKIEPEAPAVIVREESRLKPVENGPAPPAESAEKKIVTPSKIENSLEIKPVVDKPSENANIKMEESDMNKLIKTPPVGSPVHPPLITVTNAPKAPIEGDPKFDINLKKTSQQPPINTDAAGEKSKTETISAASPNQVVNENSQSSNSDSEFSELFTEDTEETEAMRLAKEMNEVDTEDLLQTSQDLISQFKRKI